MRVVHQHELVGGGESNCSNGKTYLNIAKERKVMGEVNLNDYYDRQQGRKKRYDGAVVKFLMRTEPDTIETQKAGRPIYKEIPSISIRWPGGDETLKDIESRDIKDYPEMYESFQACFTKPSTGTPLTEWPAIGAKLIQEVAYFKIRTVEGLIEMPEEVAMLIDPAGTLRDKAKDYIESATSGKAEVTRLKGEVKKLEAANSKLKDQVHILLQRIESLEGTRLTHDSP